MIDILLTNNIPGVYIDLDDQGVQQKMMDIVFQPVFVDLAAAVEQFTGVFDIDNCSPGYLVYHAWEIGWLLDPSLPLPLQRKIVSLISQIYSQKGTRLGIINAMRLFLGLTVTIFADNTDGWQLGESELGIGTILSPDPSTPSSVVTFILAFPRDLTSSELVAVTSIINFMKYHYEIAKISQPGTAPLYWTLGDDASKLDSTTALA
jgi:phage tail-like protein